LFFKIGLELLPDCQRSRRRTDKERFVAFVRCDIANDEIADIDRRLPTPGLKTTPCLAFLKPGRIPGYSLHWFLPSVPTEAARCIRPPRDVSDWNPSLIAIEFPGYCSKTI